VNDTVADHIDNVITESGYQNLNSCDSFRSDMEIDTNEDLYDVPKNIANDIDDDVKNMIPHDENQNLHSRDSSRFDMEVDINEDSDNIEQNNTNDIYDNELGIKTTKTEHRKSRPGDFYQADMANGSLAVRYFEVSQQKILDLRNRIVLLKREIRKLQQKQGQNIGSNDCVKCKVRIIFVVYVFSVVFIGVVLLVGLKIITLIFFWLKETNQFVLPIITLTILKKIS
jgi:hypothetical protein